MAMGNGRADRIRPGSRHRRHLAARRRNVWLIAGIPALAAMALAAGVIITMHKAAPPAPVPGSGTVGAPSPAAAASPPPASVPNPGTTSTSAPAAASLADDFARLETKLQMKA